MILEYNYDKGNEVLDLFNEGKLATLDIRTVKESEDDEPRFVMEYTLVEDYTEKRQRLIKEALSNSLPERLQLTNVLNTFIENQILKKVNSFLFKFNAVSVRKCEISYSSSYKTFEIQKKDVNLVKELESCLERFDYLTTEMGIADQKTSNIYKKEGGSRSKKYALLSIKDVANVLRQSLNL